MKKRNVQYNQELLKIVEYLADGRSLDDQLDHIEKTGNHTLPRILRAGLLNSIGVPEPKANSENFLLWSCMVPFWAPIQLRDMVKLLDLLGITYNHSSEKELCCGAPPLQDSIEFVDMAEEERQKVKERAKKFMQFNWDLGKKAGAKNMIYICHICTALVKNTFPDDADRHRWVFDVILDKLEEKELEIAPVKMGYYEGCHKYFPYMGCLDWPRYRQMAGKIKGLTLVDLEHKYCCKQHPERILKEAEEKGLDKILVPCGDGNYFLAQEAKGKFEIKSFAAILMEAVGI